MISFGPVPSRRLGRSLGINNIPPKICPYSCVYCQLGRTIQMEIDRSQFYQVEEILGDVENRLAGAKAKDEQVDFLSYVPDGEPTLDRNLGQEIETLKALGIPIAVISNSSLIWRKEVREELAGADWVSLKMDSVVEDIWRKVNRPHGSLELERILEGALAFAGEFQGDLVTETMLIKDLNDSKEQIEKVAEYLSRLQPARAYLAIPTRPPAEEWAMPPDERLINQAYQVMSERLPHVEYLIGYEGSLFASTGDPREDLLSIMSVHPMRKDAVEELLERVGEDWRLVRELVEGEELVETQYGGYEFYLRKLRRSLR